MSVWEQADKTEINVMLASHQRLKTERKKLGGSRSVRLDNISAMMEEVAMINGKTTLTGYNKV